MSVSKYKWNKECTEKISNIKIKFNHVGSSLESIKIDIDNGNLYEIGSKIDDIPVEYLEVVYKERILRHGLLLYQWTYSDFLYPVKYPHNAYISSEFFDKRINKGKIINHGSIDIICTTDYSVLASASGVVIDIGYKEISGKYITIKHCINGKYYLTEYSHLEEIYIKKDYQVNKGETIGIIGRSGNTDAYHLDFTIKKWVLDLKKYIKVNPVSSTTYGMQIR